MHTSPITKRRALELLGDYAKDIDVGLRVAESEGWNEASWESAENRCVIYATKMGRTWKFRVLFDHYPRR